jgi:hypothetical protein
VEFIKKVGFAKLLGVLSRRVVDRAGDYELHDLDLGLGSSRYSPYLKMVNPSTGEVHLEGVDPDCDSVGAALVWRNGTKEKPVVVT